MLFEEAVMLAEAVRDMTTWRLVAIEYVGGEIYTLRVRSNITGVSYLIEDQLVWKQVRDITERALYEVEK